MPTSAGTGSTPTRLFSFTVFGAIDGEFTGVLGVELVEVLQVESDELLEIEIARPRGDEFARTLGDEFAELLGDDIAEPTEISCSGPLELEEVDCPELAGALTGASLIRFRFSALNLRFCLATGCAESVNLACGGGCSKLNFDVGSIPIFNES